VWNLVTRDVAEAMNRSSAAMPPEVDEFTLAGLTPVLSRMFGVPRVGESHVAFECRSTQIIELQGTDGRGVGTWLVLGEVVGVHIDRRLLRDGINQTEAAAPVLRGGGPADYFKIAADSLFRMFRPR
jgi:flavin reductase (DIM6/NTAB) family NADH-FMN oxidoreductase RutF